MYLRTCMTDTTLLLLRKVFCEALCHAHSDGKDLLCDACVTSLARTAALRQVGDVMGNTMWSALQAVPPLTGQKVLRSTMITTSRAAIGGPEEMDKGAGVKVGPGVVHGDRGNAQALTTVGSVGGVEQSRDQGINGSQRSARAASSGIICIYIYVCIYMYTYVCIKRA
jgi:hypothetical protein